MQRIRFASRGYSVHEADPEEIARIEREVEETRRREQRMIEERQQRRQERGDKGSS